MADVTDVMSVIAGQVAAALYPTGTGQPSIAGVKCKVYPGWPTASQLDSDLLIGTAHVTVYPRPEEENTTRYMTQTQSVPATTPTLTLAVNAQTITVGGSIPSPSTAQNLAIFVGGTPYLYAVQATDTLTTIATGLATLIAVGVPGATSSGPVIAIPAGHVIGACRVGTSGIGIRETRRQKRLFQICVWADTPAHRDAVCAPIDASLSDIFFLTMPDGFAARLLYKNSPFVDALQKEKLYRRDFYYWVEFATTVADPQFQIIAVETNISADGTTDPPTRTLYQ